MTPGVTLRKEQQDAVSQVVKFLKKAKPGKRRLVASATGTGKSYVELAALTAIAGGVLLSTSNDIIIGILKKLGVDASRDGEQKLREVAGSHGIYTPLYYRNRLLDGTIEPPKFILWDEVHHQTADSWSDVSMLADCPEVGFTATPYRGTAKGTQEFRSIWGEPNWIYTFPDAVARGFVTLPEVTTVPLVDDDVIEVTGGEFQVRSVEAETRSRLVELKTLIESYKLDRATMVAVPTVATAQELAAILAKSVVVTGDTPRAERNKAYADMLACRKILIQVAVVGEGVDLAVRRIFDAAPTLSPVRWVQLFGRLTRPGGVSQYICTNRNLLRHVYTLQGVIPAHQVAQSQAVFGLGTRSGQRAFGLEGLGRFKANPLPMANGLQGELYLLENSDKKGTIRQYACILHPLHDSPLWATRVNVAGTYADWEPAEAPEGFKGFSSGNGSVVTEKQLNWWKRSAGKYGLDVDHKPNRRSFAALPVLAHLGLVMEN